MQPDFARSWAHREAILRLFRDGQRVVADSGKRIGDEREVAVSIAISFEKLPSIAGVEWTYEFASDAVDGFLHRVECAEECCFDLAGLLMGPKQINCAWRKSRPPRQGFAFVTCRSTGVQRQLSSLSGSGSLTSSIPPAALEERRIVLRTTWQSLSCNG